jgi:hypothetical protein
MVIGSGCSRPERPSQPEIPPLRQGTPRTEGDLRYSATTLVMESFPVQLATTVTVANIGSRPAALEFSDGCPVLLRAYRAPDRTAPPAWDQERETFCTLAIQQVTITPGESREFTVRTDARQILGDSLPNGRYLLTAVLRKTGWPLELDAGEVELAR